MFRGSVKSTGYPLHSPLFPFTSPPVRHRVPSHFNWTLPRNFFEETTRPARGAEKSAILQKKRIPFFWVVTQRVVVIPYRRLGLSVRNCHYMLRKPQIKHLPSQLCRMSKQSWKTNKSIPALGLHDLLRDIYIHRHNWW